MIGIIDEIAIYFTFGLAMSATGYLIYFLRDINSRTKLNTEFSSKVIMAIQDMGKSVTESQASVNMLMQTLGMPIISSDKEKINKSKSKSKKSNKNTLKTMDYAG